MGILSYLGAISPAHINLFTRTQKSELVGEDAMGNKYYRSSKPRAGSKRERRWVIYKGAPEASKVPPEWHGWLHHQTDAVPAEENESFRREWQKPHQPNMTGTNAAYRPPGHILEGGKRDKATGDYEAWTPSE
ncbi:MAG: NADH:ubiquinone oxidoreductase subunit NDUFA12 [Micavibrio sp. TMED27]|nr:NADH:ubiquinone oxidoreductase subunit NDUFA12 [Micavibrio sp.]OUT92497.1 MAG: NADH:ubiquinone oxidoreductase subunit NDUFA12 [Micavibrio sp. TMED27]|tara:strand:+ start:4159 stop:4557 length:399 start_codon:yes stop_codon:yes gene_type:complete